MVKSKSVLGRGLDSLISTDVIQTAGSSTISQIDLSLIDPNSNQPRKDFDSESLQELADSIANIGLVQPITLRKMDNGRYQIIAGERRFRASKLAKLESIPAYIRTASDENVLEMALIENIQREDLNSIEIALAYQNLMEGYNITQEQMASKVGKKRATVANYVRLLKLPAEIQMAIQEKKLDMGHARALLSVEDAELQIQLFHDIVEKGYSVRKVEDIVKRLAQPEENPQEKMAEAVLSYPAYSKRLTKLFGPKVKLRCSDNGKGAISIPFKNKEELKQIMEMLGNIQQ